MSKLILVLAVLLSFLSCDQGTSAGVDTTSEQALLGRVNEYRTKHGIAPLHFSPQLTLTARWMADDMAGGNYLSHTDSRGRKHSERMGNFGYDYNVWTGENLAAGSNDPQVIFELWRTSLGHNANLLNPHFVVAGLAKSYDPDSVYGWYWAIEFGGYDDRVWFRCWIPFLRAQGLE